MALLYASRSGAGWGAVVTRITRTNLKFQIAAIAAIAAGAAIGAGAQQPTGPVAVDVSECVKLTTPEERLACFEAQVEDSRKAPAPAATAAPAAAATTAAAAASAAPASPVAAGAASAVSVDEFGLDNGDLEPAGQEIQARVTDLRQTVPHAYLITLDNGQVWRQTVPKNYGLREGIPVRIYYSKWRAYRLTNEQLKSFIQVERVR